MSEGVCSDHENIVLMAHLYRTNNALILVRVFVSIIYVVYNTGELVEKWKEKQK